jgi:hypothetical protein
MYEINYNLKRHVELLKQKKKVLSENKSFIKENPSEDLELNKYNLAVENSLFWEDRFKVASVIEAFLNKKMNAHEFHDSVFGLRRKQLAKCHTFLSKLVSEEIKDFSPNKDGYKLQGFLSAFYSKCVFKISKNIVMKIDQLRLVGKVNLIFFTFPRLVIFSRLNFYRFLFFVLFHT